MAITEQQIIERISGVLGQPPDPEQIVGIGDDAAVLNSRQFSAGSGSGPSGNIAVTTDLLIEGVHFNSGYMTMADVGFKSLAVNLSDIAAMGGDPLQAFGVLGVPGDTTLDEVDSLLEGICEAASSCKVRLAGGDTVKSPVWVVGFTVLGRVPGTGLTRAGGQPGDCIWHSGSIGLSHLGWKMLASGKADPAHPCVLAHTRPQPHLTLGLYLREQQIATSCIDLSDSLSQCAVQLAVASGTGLELDFSGYRFDSLLGATDDQDTCGLSRQVLESAEDYELLFTASPAKSEKLSKYAPESLTMIGRLLEPAADLSYIDESGIRHPLCSSGFDHFSPDRIDN